MLQLYLLSQSKFFIKDQDVPGNAAYVLNKLF